jgi:hypothetical protein
MGPLLVKSLGFEVGQCQFPQFRLHGGEAITLCMPSPNDRIQDQIILGLIGKKRAPGLVIQASVVLATPANPQSDWLRWLRNETPCDWLARNTTLKKEQIRCMLDKHGLDGKRPLSNYAGTPRMLLGLEKAYAEAAEVVIFSTAGLDPLGIEKVFRTVAEYLPKCAAMYLAWPYCSEGKERHSHFPGSLRVSVTRVAVGIDALPQEAAPPHS